MPYIEVKATENRLTDPAVRERLIAELTDAACRVFGEDLRPNIWVVVEAVPGQQWGVGGKPLSLQVACPAFRQPDHRDASSLPPAPGAVVRVGRKAPRRCDSHGHPTVTRMRRPCASLETSRERRTARARGGGRSRAGRSHICRDLGGIRPAVGFAPYSP